MLKTGTCDLDGLAGLGMWYDDSSLEVLGVGVEVETWKDATPWN